MSAAFGSIHEYQIDQPSLCSPASLSRSTNHKGHKANPIISVDRSLHISLLCRVEREAERAFMPNADQLGMEVIGMLWEVGVERFC